MDNEEKAKKKSDELEQWYKDETSNALTQGYKDRVQKEYDKRKAKGDGKPIFFATTNEESIARQKTVPSYAASLAAKENQAINGEKVRSIGRGVGQAVVGNREGLKETTKGIKAMNDRITENGNTIRENENKMPKKDDNKKDVDTTSNDGAQSTSNENVFIENTNEGVANAKAGDKIKKSDGTVVTLTQNDIEYAKNKIGASSPKETTAPANAQSKSDENNNVSPSDRTFGVSDDAEASNIIKSTNDEAKESGGTLSYEDVDKNASDAVKRIQSNYKKIDTGYTSRIPTFLAAMYKRGDFGTPGTSEAKTSLGFAIIDEIGSKIRGVSNVAGAVAGKNPNLDTTSAAQKIRNTNLESSLKDYNKNFENSVESASNEIKTQFSTKDLDDEAIRQISRNLIQMRGNDRITAKDKELMFNAQKKLGSMWGSMSNDARINYITGIMALSGDSKQEGIALIASALGTENLSKLTGATADVVNSGLGGFADGVNFFNTAFLGGK